MLNYIKLKLASILAQKQTNPKIFYNREQLMNNCKQKKKVIEVYTIQQIIYCHFSEKETFLNKYNPIPNAAKDANVR